MVHEKTKGKRRLWSYKVWRLEEVSHETLVLMLQHASSRVSGFLWPRRVYRGSCKTYPFRRFPSRLSCLFLRGRRVTWCYSHVLETCWKSFCAAGAIRLCRFQKMSCSFSWQVYSTLETSTLSIRGRRSTLDVLCCVFVANRIVSVKWRQRAIRVAGVGHRKNVILRGKRVIWCGPPCVECPLAWQAQCFGHFTLDTPALYTWHTLHSTLNTPQSTLDTPHSTLYTWRSRLYIPHSTLYTPHSTHRALLYPLHFTL